MWDRRRCPPSLSWAGQVKAAQDVTAAAAFASAQQGLAVLGGASLPVAFPAAGAAGALPPLRFKQPGELPGKATLFVAPKDADSKAGPSKAAAKKRK